MGCSTGGQTFDQWRAILARGEDAIGDLGREEDDAWNMDTGEDLRRLCGYILRIDVHHDRRGRMWQLKMLCDHLMSCQSRSNDDANGQKG